jgi:hypothetical protein
MSELVALLVTGAFFIVLSLAHVGHRDNSGFMFLRRWGSVLFPTKLRAALILELSWASVTIALVLFLAFDVQTGVIDTLLFCIVFAIGILLEVDRKPRTAGTGSPISQLMVSRVDYESRHSPDLLEETIESTIKEAEGSRDARQALSILAERDDEIGDITDRLQTERKGVR